LLLLPLLLLLLLLLRAVTKACKRLHELGL
jgi:hypothetical protein